MTVISLDRTLREPGDQSAALLEMADAIGDVRRLLSEMALKWDADAADTAEQIRRLSDRLDALTPSRSPAPWAAP